jgi:hypothetical protein
MKKVIESIFLYGAVALITFAVVYAAFGVYLFVTAPEEEQDYPVVDEHPLEDKEDNDSFVPVYEEEEKPSNAPWFSYAEEELVYEGDAPVYVTVFSHNEDSWNYQVNTEDKYDKYRLALIDRAELLAAYEVPWNWQTDQPVVEAMMTYENDPERRERTEGMNVLQYLSSIGASLDPHAHKNNYADIVYLIEEELNADASTVIGGTIFEGCGSEYLGFLDFQDWRENVGIAEDGYVYGRDYPEAKWKPEILSDPGMGGHYFDEWHSGVWYPGSNEFFYSNNPYQEIIYIGEGYPHDNLLVGSHQASGAEVFATEGQYIKELVEKIQAGEVPTGTKDGKQFMYTASIHVRDTAVVEESEEKVITLEGLEVMMEELLPLKEEGEIIFVDFEEAARIWVEEYESVPWKLNLDEFSFYEDVRTQAEMYCKTRSSE